MVIKNRIYLLLLLLFILLDETSNNYILQFFHTEFSGLEFVLFFAFSITQIFIAPIQSSFSDLYCRKKSLVFSLSFTCISLFVIFLFKQKICPPLFTLILIVFAKAGLGNSLPLSWAGIADTRNKNFRFSLGLSTSAIAFGWLLLLGINKLFPDLKANIYLIFVYLLLILLCSKYFRDIRDSRNGISHQHVVNNKSNHFIRDIQLIYYEIILLLKELKNSHIQRGLLAFFLWQMSFYCMNTLDIDLRLREFSDLSAVMMIGYLLGVVILKFCEKISDPQMIRLGYITCISSIVSYLILFPLLHKTRSLLLTSFFFYNLGTAFLPNVLFAMLSKERLPHEQGRLYGLIDSTDTLAFLISSSISILYSSIKLSPVFIVAFSFILFLISWISYKKFEEKKVHP